MASESRDSLLWDRYHSGEGNGNSWHWHWHTGSDRVLVVGVALLCCQLISVRALASKKPFVAEIVSLSWIHNTVFVCPILY